MTNRRRELAELCRHLPRCDKQFQLPLLFLHVFNLIDCVPDVFVGLSRPSMGSAVVGQPTLDSQLTRLSWGVPG